MFIELLSSERDNKFSFSVDTFWFCLTFLASQKHTSTLLVTLLTYWRSWSWVLQKWLLLLHFFKQSLYSNSTQVQIDCFLWHIRCLQWWKSPAMVSAENEGLKPIVFGQLFHKRNHYPGLPMKSVWCSSCRLAHRQISLPVQLIVKAT